MAGDVRVIYRKHDGSLHWHLVTRWLGEDEHGIWTGAARPTTMRKGDGPPVILDYASVMLFPRDAWWTAAFNDAPARTEIYCDITTPVQWPSRTEVTMIDLDLDVCRTRRGAVELLDEDEFASHQVRYRYPADVITQAERSAARLRTALAEDREPFASVYRSYLRLVTGSGQADQAGEAASRLLDLDTRACQIVGDEFYRPLAVTEDIPPTAARLAEETGAALHAEKAQFRRHD